MSAVERPMDETHILSNQEAVARVEGGRGDALTGYRRIAVAMALTDAAAVMVALIVSYLLWLGGRQLPLDFLVIILLSPIVWVGVFRGFRLYATQHLSPLEEFRRTISATSAGMVLVVMASFWSKGQFSRAWVGLTWIMVLVLELSTRRLWRKYLAHLRTQGRLVYRTLIVGGNGDSGRLADKLSVPGLGFLPIGRIVAGESDKPSDGLPVLGTFRDLRRVIKENGIECLFVASGTAGQRETHQVAVAARQEGIEAILEADVPEFLASRLTVRPLGRLMALSIMPTRLTSAQAIAKRAFDVLAGLLLVVLLLPILLGAALAIRISSRGPVFFRQVRVGRGGHHFSMVKFRSMEVGAESLTNELADRNEHDGRLFKVKNDPRVTTVGRFLRRWSIDELPQLLNVIRGEMSLVGPRPALPEEVAAYEDWHRDRLEVPPGITGLWQVNGRSAVSFDEYARLDIYYIENWSLWFDFFILLKTLPQVFRGQGAY
ncbi:MAG: sugar transferase [Actinomycetota bacterium]